MTAAGDPPTADRQELFEDLYDALADLRRGDHIGRTAQRLLRVDRDAELVALIDDGERAVVYHPRAHTLTAEAFDAHGIHEDESELLWRRASDPAAWIDANAETVDWVHPRYRWICDLDSEQTTWTFLRTGENGRLQTSGPRR